MARQCQQRPEAKYRAELDELEADRSDWRKDCLDWKSEYDSTKEHLDWYMNEYQWYESAYESQINSQILKSSASKVLEDMTLDHHRALRSLVETEDKLIAARREIDALQAISDNRKFDNDEIRQTVSKLERHNNNLKLELRRHNHAGRSSASGSSSWIAIPADACRAEIPHVHNHSESNNTTEQSGPQTDNNASASSNPQFSSPKSEMDEEDG